jgi:hypothetical protein
VNIGLPRRNADSRQLPRLNRQIRTQSQLGTRYLVGGLCIPSALSCPQSILTGRNTPPSLRHLRQRVALASSEMSEIPALLCHHAFLQREIPGRRSTAVPEQGTVLRCRQSQMVCQRNQRAHEMERFFPSCPVVSAKARKRSNRRMQQPQAISDSPSSS